jgi:16S rRNA (cytidine1402-2'-O)-methyltransferase
MLTVWGNRNIAVCRELTKLFEEVIRLPLVEALQHFKNNPPMGEFTLVIEGNHEPITWSTDRILVAIKAGLSDDEKPSILAGKIAQASGHPKKEIYRLIESQKQ